VLINELTQFWDFTTDRKNTNDNDNNNNDDHYNNENKENIQMDLFMDRKQCEKTLKSMPPGTFMLRISATIIYSLVLSYAEKHKNNDTHHGGLKYKHIVIERKDTNQYAISYKNKNKNSEAHHVRSKSNLTNNSQHTDQSSATNKSGTTFNTTTTTNTNLNDYKFGKLSTLSQLINSFTKLQLVYTPNYLYAKHTIF